MANDSEHTDHNYYSRNHFDPSLPSADYDVSPQRPASRDTAPYTFRQSTYLNVQRPPDSPSFGQYASDASVRGFTTEPPKSDGSPDPANFYRQYRDSFRREPGEGYGQLENGYSIGEQGMATSRSPQRPTSVLPRANGFPVPISVHSSNRSDARSSASTAEKPLPNTRPGPASPLRPRQTNLQTLVNRFNQTTDQPPPLPGKTGTRSASAATNPVTSNTPRNLQPRNVTDTVQSRNGYPSPVAQFRNEHSERSSALPNRRKYAPSTAVPNTEVRNLKIRMEPSSTAVQASQSMTNLSPTTPDKARKPLFGEILAVNTSMLGGNNTGYGIPPDRPRRGSEGSMHNPNPMFTESPANSLHGPSPSSPTAWYLGVTPSLDGINLNKATPRPSNSHTHRRSRSDIPLAFGKPQPSSALATHVTIMSPPHDSFHAVTPPSAKRNSQSRIPISTHRMSINSDSDNSSASTRPSSVLGQYTPHRKLPPKALNNSIISRPESLPASQPERTITPRRSPRRTDSPLNARTSPRLQAFISEPPPLKSPPLRSSRPRQPVSTASTSASRARAAERSVSNASPTTAKARDRTSRTQEAGTVDFAARRQQIQRAFTKTVKANERLEFEKKRASRAQAQLEAQRLSQEQQLPVPAVTPDNVGASAFNNILSPDQMFRRPTEEIPRSEWELKINTSHLSERSVHDIGDGDSPTLGASANSYICQGNDEDDSPTPPSDTEPISAVSVGTVETSFDQDPQEDVSNPNLGPGALARGHSENERQSPSMNNDVVTEGSTPSVDHGSDRDDRESIHIMLGASIVPTLERRRQGEYAQKMEPSQNGEGDSRWSTGSWSSSVASKERPSLERDRETPMERIDEHSLARPDGLAHASLSTVASSYARPWSPDSNVSPISGRTTLDSDSYNTITRVLDSYHDRSFMSPQNIDEISQRLFSQSPNLARAGGWDPKKVTQLYLQNLARTKSERSGIAPDSVNTLDRVTEGSVPVTPIGEESEDLQDPDQGENYPSAKIAELETGKVVESNNLTVSENINRQRASLNHPDDWANTSPSMLDWIYHQADDTPTEDTPHAAPSEWNSTLTGIKPERAATPKENQTNLTLPEIQRTEGGLGININIVSPYGGISPRTANFSPIQDDLRSDSPRSFKARQSVAPIPSKPASSPPAPQLRSQSSYPNASLGQSMDPGPLAKTRSNDSSQRSNSTEQVASSTPPSTEPRTSIGTLQSEGVPKGPPSTEPKKLVRRGYIIKELVDTESSFSQDMTVVDDIYKGTSNVILDSAEDSKILFGNSDQIVAFSTAFLDALKQASKSVYVLPKSKRWRSKRDSTATSGSNNTDDQASTNNPEQTDEEKDRQTSIGQAFSNHLAQMEKVYAEYLKNHEAANAKLLELQKAPRVNIWLTECRTYAHDLTSAWDLDSLLVKPVQRIAKYPLLLKDLLEATPENHPDWAMIDMSHREIVGLLVRINDAKRRADLVDQVVNAAPNTKKRKDYEGRLLFPKAFGRNKEKLRQNVGLSDHVQDKVYDEVAEKMGSHYFQLQVVMRDVDMYTRDTETFVGKFNNFVLAIEEYMDVGQTTYPEVESKWRRFRLAVREIQLTALSDHNNAVKKYVIDPMSTLLKLHDQPLKLIKKREKRVLDFAKFKASKDRGDKPDKKTAELGEQFVAVNETLKEELPLLFAHTAKLVEACLNNFVQLQIQWMNVWKRKLSQAIDDHNLPSHVSQIIDSFSGDFRYTEAQVLSLGICNGSLLADAANLVNFLSPGATTNSDNDSRRPSAQTIESRARGLSTSSEVSPMLPTPDFGRTNHDTLGLHFGANSQYNPSMGRRIRANSSTSGRSPVTPDIPGGWRPSPITPHPNRPSTSTGRSYESPVLDTNHISGDPRPSGRLPSISHYYTAPREAPVPGGRPSSPSSRYSGVFSSAMPMSDSPRAESPPEGQGNGNFNILFLAASVYEFNIDKARREAGYPYLTYVAGEIFDVIGEKGELWLAKNQDDATNLVGWIWNKHFAKLAS